VRFSAVPTNTVVTTTPPLRGQAPPPHGLGRPWCAAIAVALFADCGIAARNVATRPSAPSRASGRSGNVRPRQARAPTCNPTVPTCTWAKRCRFHHHLPHRLRHPLRRPHRQTGLTAPSELRESLGLAFLTAFSVAMDRPDSLDRTPVRLLLRDVF